MPDAAELLAVLLLVPGVLAQGPQPVTATMRDLGSGAGLQAEADGTLLGLGRDYKVHFLADRLQFVPYLGMAAPRDLPLGMVTTHLGRGELAPVGKATRQRGELRVDYVRSGFIERLDVRPEGLEQSFVFAQLPPGDGDLVVRTAITTELTADAAATTDALHFSFPAAGGVTISQVVGIDANGARATGSMRCRDGHLDFVLPADFVATAALPLVLDPFLTTVVNVNVTTADDREPYVARIGQSGSVAGGFLSTIVWSRIVSATNRDLHAAKVTDTGAVQPTLLGIETTTADASHHRIGAQQDSLQFLIVWQQDGNVMGRRIDPTGLLSAAMTMKDTADTLTSPDVLGGAMGFQSNLVRVVWLNETQNQIESGPLNLAFATQVLGAPTVLVTGSATIAVSSPVVSRDPRNDDGMLTWVQELLTHGTFSLRGLHLQKSIGIFGPAFTVASNSTGAFNQSVAGDGDVWLVAYEHDTAASQNLSCRPVRTVDNSTFELGPPRSLASGATVTGNPDVAMFDGSAIVAWTRANGAQFDVVMTSVDPLTGQDCEGQVDVDLGGNASAVRICSCYSALPVSIRDQCQLVWTPLNGSQGDVAFRRYQTIDGDQIPAGGGCHPAAGVAIYGNAARVGNANFGFQLHRATVGELTFVVLSTGVFGGNLPCGPCTVVPDTVNGVILFTGVADAVGGVRYGLAIPNNPLLANVLVSAQFVMFGTNCLSNFNLSPAIRSQIQ